MSHRFKKIVETSNGIYYLVTSNIIGSGSAGVALLAYELGTNEEVIYKHCRVQSNEIKGLKAVNMYLAHSIKNNYIIMKKPRGVSYHHILRNKMYSNDQLIAIHKRIVEKYHELAKHNIAHMDPKPEHVFVDITLDGKIHVDLIDFGHSLCENNADYDVKCFNNKILSFYKKYITTEYAKYIETGELSSLWYKKTANAIYAILVVTALSLIIRRK